MADSNNAVGGYMPLELPSGRGMWHTSTLNFQSERAAFHALLINLPEIKRVWLPHYICNSMVEAAKSAGKELEFYPISEDFQPCANLKLACADLLLYVNYFGVNDVSVAKVLSRFASSRVVIDCAQAFFSGPFPCLATLYSPRKFFGVPDGGLLTTNLPMMRPEVADNSSIDRMRHLLQRLASSPEDGYEDYLRAEDSLEDSYPLRMSQLTSTILNSVDYSTVFRKRAENFSVLHSALSGYNQLTFTSLRFPALCYPFLSKSTNVSRHELSSERIFVPQYWPEVSERAGIQKFELVLANNLLPLPCHQNMSADDLDLLVSRLAEL